jgi:hypothetical protein
MHWRLPQWMSRTETMLRRKGPPKAGRTAERRAMPSASNHVLPRARLRARRCFLRALFFCDHGSILEDLDGPGQLPPRPSTLPARQRAKKLLQAAQPSKIGPDYLPPSAAREPRHHCHAHRPRRRPGGDESEQGSGPSVGLSTITRFQVNANRAKQRAPHAGPSLVNTAAISRSRTISLCGTSPTTVPSANCTSRRGFTPAI